LASWKTRREEKRGTPWLIRKGFNFLNLYFKGTRGTPRPAVLKAPWVGREPALPLKEGVPWLKGQGKGPLEP